MPSSRSTRPVSDVVLIIFSLFLGFVVWAIARQSETVIRPVPLEVQLVDRPPWVDVREVRPREVMINFAMKQADEGLVRARDEFRLLVSLDGIADSAGLQSYTSWQVPDVNLEMQKPPELQPATDMDEFASIIVEAKIRQASAEVTVPIDDSRLPEGYYVDDDGIVVDPATIPVAVGPQHRDGGTVQVETETIVLRAEEIEERASMILTKSARVKFDAVENLGIFPLPASLPESRRTVQVSVTVRERTIERTFTNIPIRYEPERPGRRAVIDPPAVDVTVTGPQSVVNAVSPDMIQLVPEARFISEEPIGQTTDTRLVLAFETTNERIQDLRNTATLSRPDVSVTFRALEEEVLVPEATPTATPEPTPAPEPEPEPQEEEPSAETPEAE